MPGVSRGGTGGGRSSGYSSRSSRATTTAVRRNRNSEKNHDDKGFVQRAAAAASVSHGSDDSRWFSLNKYTNAVADYFDWSESEWIATCRALKVLYDECESKAGKGHPKCQYYLGSMKYEECDACPKTDEEGAGSGFRYSLIKFFQYHGSKDKWDDECRRLKWLYGECRSNSGDNHPDSQFYRRWMIDNNCGDYIKMSDEEAADTSFRSSIRRFIWYMTGRIDASKKCLNKKSLYDECRLDLGDNNPVCQNLRRKMIEEKCDGDLKKSDKEAAHPSIASKFFRDVYKRLDKDVECKRLHDLYVTCSYRYETNICQGYLKHMSENKCPDMKENSA